MITRDHAQEGLSRAYIHAVSAAARVNAALNSEFDYGFDGFFNMVIDRGIDTDRKHHERFINDGYPISFQLKCSWTWTETADHINWNIKTKTYNDLVYRNSSPGGVRAVLILMCLPRNEIDWLAQDEDSLLLRRCCYYQFLTGPLVPNDNSTKLISIPRANVFSPASLLRELEDEKRRKMGMFDDD